MKDIILKTYAQLFEKLLHEINETKKINEQPGSQPQFLLDHIKGKIHGYLENMFYVTVFTKQDSERIYDPEWQKELTRVLYSHFQSIKRRDWSHFNFKMIELFEFCMMEVCDKYHVNANIIEITENIPSTISIEEKIEKNSKEVMMTKFPGIVSLTQLESYPLRFILQENKNHFSRVAPNSVFAKIFNPETKGFSFKAYYYSPPTIKKLDLRRTYMSRRKWEISISERDLHSYEVYDFKLGIKKLKKLHRDVLKLFKSQDFSWMPLELCKIIISYVVYEIPFKLIGKISLEDDSEEEDAPQDLNTRSGLDLFYGMKPDEVCIKYNFIYYYYESSRLIHRWTKNKLEKGIYYNCKFELPHMRHGIRALLCPPPFVEKISEKRSDTKNLLEFISKSSRKKSNSGQVFQHVEKDLELGESLIYNFKIN